MGNLQSSTPSSRVGTKSRNKRPPTIGTRDWLLGGATRVLRKPVAPAPAAAEVEAATADHVTVTSRDLRRQRTPPARDDDTDHHADEQQQQHWQEHHCSSRRRRHRHRPVRVVPTLFGRLQHTTGLFLQVPGQNEFAAMPTIRYLYYL